MSSTPGKVVDDLEGGGFWTRTKAPAGPRLTRSRRASLLQTALLGGQSATAVLEGEARGRGFAWQQIRLTPPSGQSDAEMTEMLTPG